MEWRIPDLSDYIFAVAKNGGPIGQYRSITLPLFHCQCHEELMAALMRDERKIMQLGKHSTGKPRIHIYTSSGLPISSFTVSHTPYKYLLCAPWLESKISKKSHTDDSGT